MLEATAEATVVMHFRDVKLALPAAELFEAPPEFMRHSSVEALLRGESRRGPVLICGAGSFNKA